MGRFPCPVQDAMLSKCLAAGAAACVAVDVKGRAVVELQKDAVMLGRNGQLHMFLPFFSRGFVDVVATFGFLEQ